MIFKHTSLVEVCIYGTLQLEFVTFVFVCQNSQRWCKPGVEVRIQKTGRQRFIKVLVIFFFWTKKQLTGILVELQGTGTRVPFFDLGIETVTFLFNCYHLIFREIFDSGNVALLKVGTIDAFSVRHIQSEVQHQAGVHQVVLVTESDLLKKGNVEIGL